MKKANLGLIDCDGIAEHSHLPAIEELAKKSALAILFCQGGMGENTAERTTASNKRTEKASLLIQAFAHLISIRLRLLNQRSLNQKLNSPKQHQQAWRC